MPIEPFGCLRIKRLKAVRIIHEPFNNVTDPPDDEEYKRAIIDSVTTIVTTSASSAGIGF
jgi:hypothetical protein